ncbi:winged helix-turn-helix transcriptional regulator [Pelagovum pacificum]|uniref:Helix-turn-helix transcriptional regulator n=1 Tax=Pelagovum pacificum TaxID=2588711 RepID=A0A5C5G9R3_9RHOB|nr:helix-turn-helix domain-containing protein [Pelagovum pacificum]QQA41826.1 helix-turn-helix transcriptional regulator [Pelagovum pacificum]TNY30730.1 helix-turn-helix transcriptional regulator [Pelagovum pacificum]
MDDNKEFRDIRAVEHSNCAVISDLLARTADKWTILVIRELGDGPIRFNELRRRVAPISQKMLSSTLKGLERDGFITRTVTPSVPPAVTYALTELGCGFLRPVQAMANWTMENADTITAAREAYDERQT